MKARRGARLAPSPLHGSNAPAALAKFQVGPRRGILCVWDNALVRFPLCAAVSFDDGKTWSKPKDIAGPTAGKQASYPSCQQAADGTLVAVWQQETPAGWEVAVRTFWPGLAARRVAAMSAARFSGEQGDSSPVPGFTLKFRA